MYKGKIKTWNDDRGFGFIKSDQLKGDTFLHISTLKGMSRKPRVGDVIHFDVTQQMDGKQKATNCRIEGVAKVATPVRRTSKSRKQYKPVRKKQGLFSKLIPLAILVSIVFGYQKFATSSSTPVLELFNPDDVLSLFDTGTSSTSTQRFSCQGKKYCSEMRSCKEAMFYQNNCPGTKMDGDRDGIPCESQHCGGSRW